MRLVVGDWWRAAVERYLPHLLKCKSRLTIGRLHLWSFEDESFVLLNFGKNVNLTIVKGQSIKTKVFPMQEWSESDVKLTDTQNQLQTFLIHSFLFTLF
jgi:hypothetical protein